MANVAEEARRAHAAGLCILPVKGDGSKAPDVRSWGPFLKRPPTADETRNMHFERALGFGVVATHDIDPIDFDDLETFERLVSEAENIGLGPLVSRIRVGYEDATPRGGRRWLLRRPNDVAWKDEVLAARALEDGKVNVLIELPTFAILAPSAGAVHPSGRPYVRLAGGFETIASYNAVERDALLTLARRFDQRPRRRLVAKASTGSPLNRRPGDAFNQHADWRSVLESHGWQISEVRGDEIRWTRPGKDHGVSATTNHDGSDLLWVFTSSTVFEPDRSYDKFGAFAVLQHNGDFAAAAAALAAQGYGESSAGSSSRRFRTESPSEGIGPEFRWLKDIPKESVHWLWPRRLARGKLTLLVGDGGLGKSRLSHDVIARLTRGADWPDGGQAECGSVVVLSAEDGAADTIRPAIEAMYGDAAKVAILEAVRDRHGRSRTFNLSTDLAQLEQVLDVTKATLVVIDPVSAYFGTALDSYRDTDVRSVLAPLVGIAERRQIAVLGIMHVGKGHDRSARHRVLGSVAFVNAARLVFAVGVDPHDDDRRLFVPVKSNLCQPAPTLAFRLEDAGQTARVAWDPDEVTGVSAEDVLNGTAAPDREQQTDATTFLRDLLEMADQGRVLSADVMKAAKRAGFAERTMWRAKSKLQVESMWVGSGLTRRSYWALRVPESTAVRADSVTNPLEVRNEFNKLSTDIQAAMSGDGSLTPSDSVTPRVRVPDSQNGRGKSTDSIPADRTDIADLEEQDFERF